MSAQYLEKTSYLGNNALTHIEMNYTELVDFLKENLKIEIFQKRTDFTVMLKLCGEVISSDSYEVY